MADIQGAIFGLFIFGRCDPIIIIFSGALEPIV